MKVSSVNFRSVFLTFICGCLSACAPDQESEATATSSKQVDSVAEAKAVLDVPQPNPDTMQERVAVLLDQNWQTLNSKLIDKKLSSEQRAQAYADFGLVAFGNGLESSAEIAFKNAVTLAPEDSRWVYFLALSNQYTGKLEDAALGFNQVLKLRENDLPTLIRLANVRFEQARISDAKSLYQRALTIDSKSAPALYGLGRVANAEEKYPEALKYFDAALELQPNADRINYYLGLIWRNLGDSEKAKKYLSKRGENEPYLVDALFDEISGGEARIDGLWVHMNSGSQAFVDGDYQTAVDEFRLATTDLPNDFRSWQSLGMALLKVDDNKGAKKAYQHALSLAKDSAVIYRELAKLSILEQDFEQAEQQFKQALEIDPRMLEAQIALAKLLARQGKNQAALNAYDRAFELDSQSSELAISRAELLVALNRNDEAHDVLITAASVDPRNANIKMTLGLVVAQMRQFIKAREYIKSALSVATDDLTRGRAHYALGQVDIFEAKPQQAIGAFEEALRLNPRHRAAGLELARSFLRVKNFKKGLATYEIYLHNWPNNDAIRVEASRVSLHIGEGDKAKELLTRGAAKPQASARLLGSLARLLILSPDPEIRNSESAMTYAKRAVGQSGAIVHLETLALCHSARKEFEAAVQIQQKILASLDSSVTAAVRSRVEGNLQRYQKQQLGRLPFDAVR